MLGSAQSAEIKAKFLSYVEHNKEAKRLCFALKQG